MSSFYNMIPSGISINQYGFLGTYGASGRSPGFPYVPLGSSIRYPYGFPSSSTGHGCGFPSSSTGHGCGFPSSSTGYGCGFPGSSLEFSHIPPDDSSLFSNLNDSLTKLSKYCGLCHQYFLKEDKIVVGYEPARCTTYQNGEVKLPRCIGLDRFDIDEDNEGGIVATHLACFNIMRISFKPGLLCVNMLSSRPSFPSPREVQLKRDLASILTKTLNLPADVTFEIAQYLIREYIVYQLLLTGPIDCPRSISLDVSAPILLRRARFRGKSYISSASNVEGPMHPERPQFLLVKGDEFGITDLSISTSVLHPPMERKPDDWWKVVKLSSKRDSIQLYHDGLKCRTLRYGKQRTHKPYLPELPSDPTETPGSP